MSKSVLVFAFDGCEEIELFAVTDILSRCGIEVNILSAFDKECITTRSGMLFDYNAGYAKFGYLALDDGYDAFYMPGGGIEKEFNKFTAENSDYFAEQLQEFGTGGGIISANCIAPSLLASINAFDFKEDYKIVCYPTTEANRVPLEHLAHQNNAKITQPKVHVDANIITGNGPAASLSLAFELAKYLIGDKIVEKVRHDMLFSEV